MKILVAVIGMGFLAWSGVRIAYDYDRDLFEEYSLEGYIDSVASECLRDDETVENCKNKIRNSCGPIPQFLYKKDHPNVECERMAANEIDRREIDERNRELSAIESQNWFNQEWIDKRCKRQALSREDCRQKSMEQCLSDAKSNYTDPGICQQHANAMLSYYDNPWAWHRRIHVIPSDHDKDPCPNRKAQLNAALNTVECVDRIDSREL